jgi:hypothetical protein
MPYKSKAQAAYFNIHRKELERQGVDVDEWNESSRGKKLPEHVAKEKKGMLDVEGLLKEAAKLPPSYYRNLYYRNPELHKLKSTNGGLASAAKAKQEEKRLAHVADRDKRLNALRNPPQPPQMELGFDKQAHVSSEMNKVLYNHLVSRGISENANAEEVLNKRSPKKKDLDAALRRNVIGSGITGGLAGLGIAENISPHFKGNHIRYSGRAGALLGALATGGIGYLYAKNSNNNYEHLTKKQKLNQINKFIDAKKNKEELMHRANPIAATAALVGAGSLYSYALRDILHTAKVDRNHWKARNEELARESARYWEKFREDRQARHNAWQEEFFRNFRQENQARNNSWKEQARRNTWEDSQASQKAWEEQYRRSRNTSRSSSGGERFNGSGNQGGGGKSDHHNPYSGDMADKYDKFMAMKRMAKEAPTDGERDAANIAVEKWKKKYKFASMLKISKLINY